MADLDLPYSRVQHAYGKSDDEEKQARRKTWCVRGVFFLLGVGIASLIILLAYKYKKSSSDDAHPSRVWRASDYEENFQYYASDSIPAHPIGVEDNMRLSRLGAAVLAPNGRVAVFTRTQQDQTGLNRSATSLWYINLPATDGYSALPLTRPIWGVADQQPNFDSHSRTVFFVSNRVSGETNGVGGLSQIFQVTLPTTTVASSSSPSSSSPLEVPIFAASSDATTAAANRRAFQRRLGANTPTDPSEESEVPQSLNGKTSLPTADEASYTEPTLVVSTAMSVDNLLVGRNAASKRSIIAFSARVFPNTTMAETASRIAAKQARSGSSHVFDKLFVRHWDEWMDGTRNHIHFVAVDQNDKGGVSHVSAPVDLMFGLDSDAPTRPDGDAHSEWSFSVTAKNFAFVRQTWDAYSNVSWTDNTDVYTVRIDPATFAADAPAFDASSVSAPECRTCDNIAIDTAPVYSPTEEDVFVYCATDVPGYESARRSVRAFFTPSTSTDLTPTWSYSVSSMVWTTSGKGILMTSRVQGRQEIILFDVASRSNVSVLAKQGTNDNVQVSPDDSFVLFTTSSYMAPQTIKSMHFSNTSAATVTDIAAGFNELALSKMVRSPMERFTFAGALDEEVQGFLFRPANYDASKTYPLAFLIHGGPQSAWTEAWSYRWNPQVWASAGYFTVMINFHGSDSFGQAFTDSITGNYGTLPYEDLMKGMAWLLEDSPYAANIDRERLAAAGASYGGYMINWIAGHNHNQTYKFKTLVCHDGLFDLYSFYFSTEELWFPEHDLQGLPWLNPEHYQQYNPAQPDLIKGWDTPMLVIHGGLDFRIDQSQSLGAFTALQRQGIPSKLLYFPNEGHQVFNTQNQLTWHREVLRWVGEWTNTPAVGAEAEADASDEL